MSSTQGLATEISDTPATVEAGDIQAIVLRPRPRPYRGEYVILRIGDARQGREMLRQLLPHVASAGEWWVPSLPGWLGIAFTLQGLEALGVPQASLDSFPVEFRQGMAARAGIVHDFGANAPANWEYPFGTSDVHVALAIYARTDQDLQQVLTLAHDAHRALPAVSVVYRMRFGELPEGRNPFGFKDGLHNPHVEGSGPAPPAGSEPSIKAGEFILGYPTRTARPQRFPFLRSCATTALSSRSANSTWM
jgi:deferrochelatase/peroxidase EfeB